MKDRGFTLIELMVVVTVTGILLGIAIFNVGPMVARINVESEATELAQLIRIAQERSITRGIPVQMTFSIVNTHINVLTQYVTTPPQFASNEIFTKTQGGIMGGAIGAVPDVVGLPPANGIGFLPNGILLFDPSGGTTTPGAIYIHNRRYQCAVSVNANGRVREWKWKGSQWLQ